MLCCPHHTWRSMRPKLNPKQENVAHLIRRGHLVVLGTAGTGKSLMAIVRAERLALELSAEPHSVLLVTFTGALKGYLSHLLRMYRQDEVDPVVDIRTYHGFARGYLGRQGVPYQPIGGQDRSRCIEAAMSELSTGTDPVALPDRPLEFFAGEFDWINDNAVGSIAEYLSVERIGRRTALGRLQREAVWRLRERYQEIRDASGYNFDWSQIASTVRSRFAAGGSGPLYRHVIIDEGQDLSPEQLRSLVDIADPQGSVTFFGDYAQRLYGQRMSWRASGLDLEGRRVERFRDNFRNSAPIARLAVAVSEHPDFSGDEEELVEPGQPDATGPLPELVRCRGRGDEMNHAVRRAIEYSRTGSVTILVHFKRQVTEILNRLRAAHGLTSISSWEQIQGITCGTYHAAKGLEFDTVILPFCDRFTAVDDDDNGGESRNTVELKKLYVGVTRARRNLVMTYSDAARPSLLPARPDLYEPRRR